MRLSLSALFLPIFLASCAVGPNYVKPDVSDITPAKWKWQEAKPRDHESRCEWWTLFKDSELNRLEKMAVTSNPTVHAAMARIDQARAITNAAGAALAPMITVDGMAKREQTSGNLPSPVPVNIPASQINTFSVPLTLSYELDLWGRIRRQIESARADTDTALADYQSVLLTLTSDVASNYFLLRSYDAELHALSQMVDTRQKTIGVVEQRFKAGNISESDFARAQAELATTRAEMADVKRAREETVAVLALLCGQPASTFTISKRSSLPTAPSIPAGIPASVLERRPDVATAERQVAAANAQIGVETAGYFPVVSLTGNAGWLSKDTSSLFSADSKTWAAGPSISIPVSSFFITKAKVARAKATHVEAVANYRMAVLSAIKDVETALTQIRYRGEQAAAINDAVTASSKATGLVRQLYDSGSLSFLELLDAERTDLTTSRQAAQVKAQRLIATVSLIKALGGKW